MDTRPAGSATDGHSLERPITLAEAVVSHLAERIVRGDLPGGSQLKEVSLASELSTSRQTVREALRQLAELGLIEISPHRGAFVTELTPQRAREIITLRALLEGYAARLVAERGVDSSILKAMEDALEAQRQAAGTGEYMPLIRSDMNFHMQLASFCGHDLVLEHLSSLQVQTRRLNVSIRQHHAELDEIVRSHLPIMKALRDGTPHAIEAAVQDHVVTSGEMLLHRMVEIDDVLHKATVTGPAIEVAGTRETL